MARAALAITAAVLLAGLSPSPPAVADPARLVPDPRTFLREEGGFSAREVAAADAGQVVAKVVDTGDNSEVMAVAATRVKAGTSSAVELMKRFEGRRRPGDVIQAGLFDGAPSARDLAPLALETRELNMLRKCRLADCDVRLPASAIARFKQEVDWSSPQAAARAAALWREVLAGFVASYRAEGNRGLPEYNNNDMAVKVGDSLARVLARSPYLEESAPEIYHYLLGYPTHPAPAGSVDYLYWINEKFWIKSVTSLNHVTIQTGEAGGRRFVVATSKQLYASQYFESSLAFTVLVEDPAGSYLMFVSRSRADIRPSGFNFIERALLRRLVERRLVSQMQWMKAMLEGRPASS